jgi:hypothetical protein
MSNTRITYAPRAPDTTPAAERNALVSVYRFIIECHANRNAAGRTSINGADEKGFKHDLARLIIPDK